MSTDQESDGLSPDEPANDSDRFVVDARGATAVQAGEGNTQIIYTYNATGTWTDGVAPTPLVDVSGSITSPYRGLAAFEERDTALFFGRETAATEVLAHMAGHLRQPGPMMVSGVSGAGKSSLLRAGVLPRIRGAGLVSAPGSVSWPCVVLTPSRAPIDQLAVRVAALAGVDAASIQRGMINDPSRFALIAAQAALTQPGRLPSDDPHHSELGQRRLVLLIDQFEQLFTQCPDEDQRAAFITAVHAAATIGHGGDHAPAALVVLVVRADFEARCADYPELTAAVQDRYLVTAMNPRQLRLAITEPAKKAHGRVEDDLVELLLKEVQTRVPASASDTGRPGSLAGAGVLPLLSHALDQAWRSRTEDILTVTDYERIGGIEGAVAESAERAYTRLTPDQQAVARQVFIRLTTTSADGIDTGDRVARTELIQGMSTAEVHDVEQVLEYFAAERLLILAADTVEISHEVLLNAWPLLRDTWLAETHADRITRSRLRTTAAEWSSHGHDRSYLYSGSLLHAATRAASCVDVDPVRHPRLSQAEREFLRASGRTHRRRLRRRRAFAALLAVVVIGFAAVAVVAYRASQNAIHERDIAVSGQLISQSETLGEVNPTLAKVDSLAAWGIDPSAQARYAMLASERLPWISTFAGDTAPLTGMALSQNGKMLATASPDSVQLWDVATRRQIGESITDHGNGIFGLAFSPDGRMLAIGIHTTVQLWDTTSGRKISSPLSGPAALVTAVAFSQDGKMLATGDGDGTTQVWNIATGQQIGETLRVQSDTLPPEPISLEVHAVSFSPDGRTLATGYLNGKVRLWNLATSQQIDSPLAVSTGKVSSLAFSPDGTKLATTGDYAVQLWDVTTGRQVGTPLSASTSPTTALAFSPDGETLATGHADGTARLWEVATGQQIGAPFTGHTGGIVGVALSANSRILATAGGDGTARLWDVTKGQQINKVSTGNTGAVTEAKFSPDGAILATAGFYTTQLWNVATGQRLGASLVGSSPLSFSPNSKIVATADLDGKVRLWDAASGRELLQLARSDGGHVVGLAFGADGRTLETASGDGAVQLWDVDSGQLIRTLLGGHPGQYPQVGLIAEGRTLVIANIDGAVQLWDVATGRRTAYLATGYTFQVYGMAFNPDGKTLATGNADGTVRMLDVTSGKQVGSSFTGHTGAVGKVTFSPDGTVLATASYDGTVRLWDVATGRPIGDALAVPGQVFSVTFSPDEKTLVTAGTDSMATATDDGTTGTIRLWDVDYLVNVTRRLCAQVGGLLTPSGWARYVPQGPPYRRVCS